MLQNHGIHVNVQDLDVEIHRLRNFVHAALRQQSRVNVDELRYPPHGHVAHAAAEEGAVFAAQREAVGHCGGDLVDGLPVDGVVGGVTEVVVVHAGDAGLSRRRDGEDGVSSGFGNGYGG